MSRVVLRETHFKVTLIRRNTSYLKPRLKTNFPLRKKKKKGKSLAVPCETLLSAPVGRLGESCALAHVCSPVGSTRCWDAEMNKTWPLLSEGLAVSGGRSFGTDQPRAV